MRYTRFVSAIIVLALLISNLNVLVFAEESGDATVTHGCHSVDAASAYLGSEKLTDNVGSAIMYETNSDTLMYAWHADETIYPSSLVKILTALIACEKGDLQGVVTVTQDALDSVPYYAASAELQVGEQITLSDLLYCMMVGSANDAAAVIAECISGSQTSFIKEMNDYANQLGCTGTQFTNVHGLHDEKQYTTVRDMARILSSAVMNEDFLKYFSAIRYIVPATNKSAERELSSGNFLMNTDNMQLYYDARVTGGRTGITDDGARCLATLAESNGMQVVCIVTGSESTFAENGSTLTYGSFKETSVLLDACFDGYQVAQILYENQVIRQCSVPGGENDVVLCSENSVYSVLPVGVTVADLSYRYEDEAALSNLPIEAGQVLSNVQVWHGGYCIAQADLKAMNSVSQADNQQTDDAQKSTGSLMTVLIVIVSVFAGIGVVLLLIRSAGRIRIFLFRRRSKQYRRSRRRSR